MSKKKDTKYTMGCLIVFLFFLFCIMVFWISVMIKHDKILAKAKTDCRDMWWYIETFYKNPDIMCRDREWKVLYFRR